MKRHLLFLVLLISISPATFAKKKLPKPIFSGIYLQWGYNRDKYTTSNVHLKNGDQYDFTIHNAHATDKPDFSGFRDRPLDVTIPQNSFRIGVYLNKKHTWAIELNFDHAKWVMTDYQNLYISGQFHGHEMDKDTVINPQFVHLEHTDGANFYHINYVHQHFILDGKKHPWASYLLKVGGGVVIPRSDVTLFGKELNNKYHVAGYIFSAEAGVRFYPLKNLFLEVNGKAGYANYLNSLAIEGGKISHSFEYLEVIGLLGYDLNFGKHHAAAAPVSPE